MRAVPRFQPAARDIIWILLICALPLVLLFQPRQQFGSDWVANIWLTAYFGEFFKQHHAFPEVLHTAQVAGLPYPVFYGFLLYPCLGLLSALTDPHAAVRLAVGGVFFLQTWQVFRLAHQAGASRLFGLVLAAVAAWSTYALTNLYNRGALNELIAVALLTAAVCLVCRACLLPADAPRVPPLAAGLLCFTLAAGAHPITAVFGGVCLGFFAAIFLVFAENRRPLAAGIALGAIAGAAALSPWLYAVLKFGPSLHVSRYYTSIVIYWSDNLDSLATRLMPFPYDRRVAENPGLSPHLSPYLDTQVTFGFILLAIFLAIRAGLALRRGVALNRAGCTLAAAGLALFVFVLVLSVSPALGGRMPDIFRNLQFAYRLVSYLNLALLLVVIGGLLALPFGSAPLERTGRWVLWLTLGWAAFGLGLKLQHGKVRQSAAPQVSGSRALKQPDGFYGGDAYAIARAPAEPGDAPPSLAFAVKGGAEFGLLAPEKITVATPQARLVRVQPFPWNEVQVNGHSVDTADAISFPQGTQVALPAGETTITYAWRPDAAWSRLKILSNLTLLAWLAFVVVPHGRQIAGRLRTSLASPASRD